jgi:hypothetical protein
VAEVQSHLLAVLFFAGDVLVVFIYKDDSNLYTRDVHPLTAQGPHSNDRNICRPQVRLKKLSLNITAGTSPLIIPYITVHSTFIYLWFMGGFIIIYLFS